MTDNPFEKVLDRLREKGWHKGSFYGPGDSSCILGASMSVGVKKGFLPTLRPLIEDQYPDRAYSYLNGSVSSFNDHPDTTFTDVERVLEKAAVKWEEERVMRDD